MRARVLGIRLLTLDAIVTLTPAEVREPAATVPRAPGSRWRLGVIDRELAAAVRGMDEGTALLARARRPASSHAPSDRGPWPT